jgi:hypothetical protein
VAAVLTVSGGECIITNDSLRFSFSCPGRELVTARAVPLARALSAAVVHRTTGHIRIGRTMIDLLSLAFEDLPEMRRPRRRRIWLSATNRSDEAHELAARYSIVAARVHDALLVGDSTGACDALWELILLARDEIDACAVVTDGPSAMEISHDWDGSVTVARPGDRGREALEGWLRERPPGPGRARVVSSCRHGDEVASALAALGREVERR